jgi:hypothetical protein
MHSKWAGAPRSLIRVMMIDNFASATNNIVSTTLKLYHKKSSCDYQPRVSYSINKGNGTTAKPCSTTMRGHIQKYHTKI